MNIFKRAIFFREKAISTFTLLCYLTDNIITIKYKTEIINLTLTNMQ